MSNGDTPYVPHQVDRLLKDVVGGLSRTPTPPGRRNNKVLHQRVDAYFFRPANVDGRNATPCMPIVSIGNAGDVAVADAAPEWWSSIYDPILHSGGYLLKVTAKRRWTRPWRIIRTAIVPILLDQE